MPFMSSQVAYPPSSSPPEQNDTLKRPHAQDESEIRPKKRLFGKSLFDPVEPLKIINANTTRAPQPATESNKITSTTISIPAQLARPQTENVESITRTGSSHVATWKEPPGAAEHIPENTDPSLTTVRNANGKRYLLRKRVKSPALSYEQIVAQRSTTEAGKATKSYYGIDIHSLLEDAKEINNKRVAEEPTLQEATAEPTVEVGKSRKKSRMMWAEKYRAKKFTDLCGDDRTHRTVLRWLKGWDSVVFPGASKQKVKGNFQDEDDKVHRKILLITGPPGLGKTTLAHVCAKQAGYEVVEINASDDRSKDVVKGRIRDCVGTENVRGVISKVGENTVRKAGRPVCVVVDEVDGVVGGSGGSGDGGFMRALIDLVHLDQKNSNRLPNSSSMGKTKKGDQFRLLRPMILICNDVYHPSLRPLRSSNLAEIIHVRKPPLDKVVARLKHVFDEECVPADTDGVRRLCEATWGISSRREDRGGSNSGEGDIRSVLVVSEWAAGKLRASTLSGTAPRMTRQWLEKNFLADLNSSSSSSSSRGLGRGGTKEAADRVFLDNAGFPKSATAPPKVTSHQTTILGGSSSATDATRARALGLLREVVDTAGDTDRIVSDVFTAYPSRAFTDDTLLSKPNAAAEWLSFHDTLSSRVHGASQAYELMPYMSSSVLAFHTLFSSAKSSLLNTSGGLGDQDGEQAEENNPFAGPRADFIAYETMKQTRAELTELRSGLSLSLTRSFRSPEHIATDLVPFLHRMLSPSVAPVLIGGSAMGKTASVRRDAEKEMVKKSVEAMGAAGIGLEKMRVEDERLGQGGFVWRMDPPIDNLATFETATKNLETSIPTRFAVRQVLAQEHAKWRADETLKARQSRYNAGNESQSTQPTSHSTTTTLSLNPQLQVEEKEGGKKVIIKKDFFGRVIKVEEDDSKSKRPGSRGNTGGKDKMRTWVSFHEGFSNAVRKPVSLAEIMAGL